MCLYYMPARPRKDSVCSFSKTTRPVLILLFCICRTILNPSHLPSLFAFDCLAQLPYSILHLEILIFLHRYQSSLLSRAAPSNPTKKNQDSFLMQNDVATSSLVIACFDGHGQFGHDVSKFCKKFMEKAMVAHPLFLTDLHTAILEVTATLGAVHT